MWPGLLAFLFARPKGPSSSTQFYGSQRGVRQFQARVPFTGGCVMWGAGVALPCLPPTFRRRNGGLRCGHAQSCRRQSSTFSTPESQTEPRFARFPISQIFDQRPPNRRRNEVRRTIWRPLVKNSCHRNHLGSPWHTASRREASRTPLR